MKNNNLGGWGGEERGFRAEQELFGKNFGLHLQI